MQNSLACAARERWGAGSPAARRAGSTTIDDDDAVVDASAKKKITSTFANVFWGIAQNTELGFEYASASPRFFAAAQCLPGRLPVLISGVIQDRIRWITVGTLCSMLPSGPPSLRLLYGAYESSNRSSPTRRGAITTRQTRSARTCRRVTQRSRSSGQQEPGSASQSR